MDEPVKPHHGIIFWSVVAALTIGYGLFNFWVYRWATSGKAPSPKEIWQKVTTLSEGFSELKAPSSSPIIPTSSPAPTPSVRPTGPGSYACSAEGDCNLYSDEMRKGCPATFADSRCLDSCGDTGKRCKK